VLRHTYKQQSIVAAQTSGAGQLHNFAREICTDTRQLIEGLYIVNFGQLTRQGAYDLCGTLIGANAKDTLTLNGQKLAISSKADMTSSL